MKLTIAVLLLGVAALCSDFGAGRFQESYSRRPEIYTTKDIVDN